jgi:hypothetical protein
MLTRNKVFEHSLKIWSEKQKDPHLNSALTKEEFAALQSIVDDAATLIKRYYKLKVNNQFIISFKGVLKLKNQNSQLKELSHRTRFTRVCQSSIK